MSSSIHFSAPPRGVALARGEGEGVGDALAHRDGAEAQKGRQTRRGVAVGAIAIALVVANRLLQKPAQAGLRGGLAAGGNVGRVGVDVQGHDVRQRLGRDAADRFGQSRQALRQRRRFAPALAPGVAEGRVDDEALALLGAQLAAFDDDAILAILHRDAGSRRRRAHCGVAAFGVGRVVAVEGQQVGFGFRQQARHHLRRIAAPHHQRAAAPRQVVGQPVQAAEQKTQPRRAGVDRAQQVVVEDEDRHQLIGASDRSEQRGVVVQAQIVAEPVQRAH